MTCFDKIKENNIIFEGMAYYPFQKKNEQDVHDNGYVMDYFVSFLCEHPRGGFLVS